MTPPNHYLRDPMNYTGNKYRLLKQILPLFPDKETFVDVFCGGGTVSANVSSTHIYMNDANTYIIELLMYLQKHAIDDVCHQIESLIHQYGLSETHIYGYEYYLKKANSSHLGSYNKPGYLALRDAFNQKKRDGAFDPIMFYTLLLFSFNNQWRFNHDGDFNMPVGKRDFTQSLHERLRDFMEVLQTKDVTLTSQDFRELTLDELPNADTLVYCDPPYLITEAVYNCYWHDEEEHDLLHWLDVIDKQGKVFALSNVLESKDQTNRILTEWLESHENYTCYDLTISYSNSNYHHKHKNAKNREVLITNQPRTVTQSPTVTEEHYETID